MQAKEKAAGVVPQIIPIKMETFRRNILQTPFLFFYEPENLHRLAQQLGLQSGIDI